MKKDVYFCFECGIELDEDNWHSGEYFICDECAELEYRTERQIDDELGESEGIC